jgi:hypothetical protein
MASANSDDWHLMVRQGAASATWRDEDDALEWAEALGLHGPRVIEHGMPLFMLFLSRSESGLTAAGLRRLARMRPADSDWLEDFASDVTSDASEVDPHAIAASNVGSGIPQWFFEPHIVWWFGELAERDARVLAAAFTDQSPAEPPILWRTSEIMHLGGDRVTAEIVDDAWGTLEAEGSALAPLREALRSWTSLAREAEQDKQEEHPHGAS